MPRIFLILILYFSYFPAYFPALVFCADLDCVLYRGDARASGCVTETAAFSESLKIFWEYRLEKGWFQATAIIVSDSEYGDTVYVGSSDDGMLAFDLKNGKLRWKYPLELGVLAPAAYSNHLIFFGDTDGILYALDAQTGKERWKFKTGGTIDNSPNIDAQTNRVLIGSQAGSLYALDTATGQPAWEYKTNDQIRCF
ncbi:MAG: PQQ-binding-like beta-propeller repeat protein, partial [Planctomycetaceae bacterium]|nr:PQQ-binding-like beta-propeller repeat protein [Planctomycetaceae bacterium]